MPRINVTNRAGEQSVLEAKTGISVMENLRDNDFEVEAICGGSCACATCHVYIGEGWMPKLSTMEFDEESLVTDEPNYQADSRLSCQLEMTEALDGLTLTIAPEV